MHACGIPRDLSRETPDWSPLCPHGSAGQVGGKWGRASRDFARPLAVSSRIPRAYARGASFPLVRADDDLPLISVQLREGLLTGKSKRFRYCKPGPAEPGGIDDPKDRRWGMGDEG